MRSRPIALLLCASLGGACLVTTDLDPLSAGDAGGSTSSASASSGQGGSSAGGAAGAGTGASSAGGLGGNGGAQTSGGGGSGAANCGDGNVDVGEECDDGAANSDVLPDACRTTCVSASCGDGVTDTGEQCDNGVFLSPDGCSGSCTIDPLVTDGATGVVHPAGFKVDFFENGTLNTAVRMSDSAGFGTFVHVMSLNGQLKRLLPDGGSFALATLGGSAPNGCGDTTSFQSGTVGMSFVDSPSFGEAVLSGTVNNSNPCECIAKTTSAFVTSLLVLGSPVDVPISAVWAIEPSSGGAFGDFVYAALLDEGIVRVDPAGAPSVFSGSFARGLRFGPGDAFGSDLYVASDALVLTTGSGGTSKTFAGGFQMARDLAFGGGGAWGHDLYVLDAGNFGATSATLLRVTPAGVRTVVASGFDVTDPAWGQIAFAGGPDYCDALYVTTYSSQTNTSAVMKLTPPAPTCGDCKLDPCEECDDGGVAPGDGCDGACRFES